MSRSVIPPLTRADREALFDAHIERHKARAKSVGVSIEAWRSRVLDAFPEPAPSPTSSTISAATDGLGAKTREFLERQKSHGDGYLRIGRAVSKDHPPFVIPDFGYHRAKIERGVMGEASKVREETEEFLDAVDQKNPVMALVELSDLMGAVIAYLAKHHPDIRLSDLLTMADATERAFRIGSRK